MTGPLDLSDFIDMTALVGTEPLTIDLVYARADHPENIFKTGIYRPEARLWLHRDMASIVIDAARRLYDRQNWTLCLKDGLRTVEAQQAMQDTPIVRANPHWQQEPNRLLSPPGKGAHPRGMAIDLVPFRMDGTWPDMGTVFDHLSMDPAVNPAHRDFAALPEQARHNRHILQGAMEDAARTLGLPLFPLPSEWWDFRMPRSVYEQFAPLHDKDLPEIMRMTESS